MISVETRIEIGRPAADVFAFVSDQTNAPRWQSGLDEVRRLTPGPIRVGSEHSFIRRFAGRRIESRNTFVAFEPGRFVAFDIPPGGGVTGEASYLVEPTSASTSALTSRVQLRFSGLGRLIEPFMATFESYGLDEQAAVHAQRAISAAIRGFGITEASGRYGGEADETFAQIRLLFVTALNEGHWPTN